MKLAVRKMTSEDIPAAVRLKDAAGWNQTALDWLRFISSSPEGCFVAEYRGEVIGTCATITYERSSSKGRLSQGRLSQRLSQRLSRRLSRRLSWIGMLIVEERYRGEGIGTTLLESAIGYLDSRRIETMKLDATPLGKPLYRKLGFKIEYEIERWMLHRAALEEPAGSQPPSGGPGRIRLEDVLELDRKIFGADRSRLLRSLRKEAPHFFLTEWNGGELTGYGFGRRGSRADQLGPWVAFRKEAAERLLDSFLLRSSRELIFIDCLLQNEWARQLVQSRGFELSRPLTRMYRGKNEYAGRIKPICAALGPEFG